MRRIVVAGTAVLVCAAIVYTVTAPSVLSADDLPTHTADAAAGESASLVAATVCPMVRRYRSLWIGYWRFLMRWA